MKNGMLAFVLSALALVGVGQVPLVQPVPLELILSLNISLATFSQEPGAPEEVGFWLIPVRRISDILNAPPSRDTAIGIMIAGPELVILYFRVESIREGRKIAYLTLRLPTGAVWASSQAGWVQVKGAQTVFALNYPDPDIHFLRWWDFLFKPIRITIVISHDNIVH